MLLPQGVVVVLVVVIGVIWVCRRGSSRLFRSLSRAQLRLAGWYRGCLAWGLAIRKRLLAIHRRLLAIRRRLLAIHRRLLAVHRRRLAIRRRRLAVVRCIVRCCLRVVALLVLRLRLGVWVLRVSRIGVRRCAVRLLRVLLCALGSIRRVRILYRSPRVGNGRGGGRICGCGRCRASRDGCGRRRWDNSRVATWGDEKKGSVIVGYRTLGGIASNRGVHM